MQDSYEFFHPTSTATQRMFPPSYPYLTLPVQPPSPPSEFKRVVKKTEVVQPASATPPPLWVPLHTYDSDYATAQDEREYECTTTFSPLVSLRAGGTWTSCKETVTKTHTLDCEEGACKVMVHPWGGLGPVISYQATVTAVSTKTKTAFVCRATS